MCGVLCSKLRFYLLMVSVGCGMVESWLEKLQYTSPGTYIRVFLHWTKLKVNELMLLSWNLASYSFPIQFENVFTGNIFIDHVTSSRLETKSPCVVFPSHVFLDMEFRRLDAFDVSRSDYSMSVPWIRINMWRLLFGSIDLGNSFTFKTCEECLWFQCSLLTLPLLPLLRLVCKFLL